MSEEITKELLVGLFEENFQLTQAYIRSELDQQSENLKEYFEKRLQIEIKAVEDQIVALTIAMQKNFEQVHIKIDFIQAELHEFKLEFRKFQKRVNEDSSMFNSEILQIKKRVAIAEKNIQKLVARRQLARQTVRR